MTTLSIQDVLESLKRGQDEPSPGESLELIRGEELIREVRKTHPLIIQERKIGSKVEMAFARRLRLIPRIRTLPNTIIASVSFIPSYLDCVFINIENDRITGVSRLNRLMMKVVHKPRPGLQMKMGRGHKLDLMPDGWSMRPFIRRKATTLSEDLLRSRGWNFQNLEALFSSPSR